MRYKNPPPEYAYAAVSPHGRINVYWVRSHAWMVKGDKWETIRKRGWRVIRVKITPAK